jgi:hypothetical protein
VFLCVYYARPVLTVMACIVFFNDLGIVFNFHSISTLFIFMLIDVA